MLQRAITESPETNGERKKPWLRIGSTEEQTGNRGTENYIKQTPVSGWAQRWTLMTGDGFCKHKGSKENSPDTNQRGDEQKHRNTFVPNYWGWILKDVVTSPKIWRTPKYMAKGAQKIPLGITPMTSIPSHVSSRNLKNKDEGKTVLKSGRKDTLSICVFVTFLVAMPKCLAKQIKGLSWFMVWRWQSVMVERWHHSGRSVKQLVPLHLQSESRERCTLLLSFRLFIQPWVPVVGWCLPDSGWVLPLQLN